MIDAKQLGRLASMHPDSSEATVIRTYLDWMADLPWKKLSKDRLDIKEAKRILDEDHFDLEKVKERILEYLSVRKLNPGMKGPILVLLVPLEFLSNILLRPVTLTLRLFATMFAGHLLLLLFSLGAEYLLLHSENTLAIPAGIASAILFVGISFLEILVMFLQAYVFTLLASMYIGEALADEH